MDRRRPGDSELAAEFGRRLRARRKELGLSQERLAELADVRRTFVGLIENGYSSPTLATIVRFANALNVDPGQLLVGIAGDGAQNSNDGRQ